METVNPTTAPTANCVKPNCMVPDNSKLSGMTNKVVVPLPTVANEVVAFKQNCTGEEIKTVPILVMNLTVTPPATAVLLRQVRTIFCNRKRLPADTAKVVPVDPATKSAYGVK